MSQNCVQEYSSKVPDSLIDQIFQKIKYSLSEEQRKKFYQAFINGMEEADFVLEFIDTALKEIGPDVYKCVKWLTKLKFGKYLIPMKATKQVLSFIAKCLKEKIENDIQNQK